MESLPVDIANAAVQEFLALVRSVLFFMVLCSR